MHGQRTCTVAGVNAGFLDVLHNAGDKRVAAIADAIDVNLDGAGKIAVDQQRAPLGNGEIGGALQLCRQPDDVAIDLAAVGDDFHATAAEHIGRPDDHGIAEFVSDSAGFRRRPRDAAIGLLEAEFLHEVLEPVAVLREINGVRRGAEDRHARSL